MVPSILLRGCVLALALLSPVAHGSAVAPAATQGEDPAPSLDVMSWNIWHGGREDGEEDGPRRVVEVIEASGVDVVAMQETYGSGPRIAKALGFHFHERGTNVSIMSRYPVLEDLSVGEPFQCVGALLALPDGERAAVFSIWQPYSAEIWAEGTRDIGDVGAMLGACEASHKSLTALHAALEERLAGPDYEGVPVVVAGDFNSMSHLDYGEVGLDQYGVAVDWPTGHVLWEAGFTDAYRETNPVIDRERDSTWTPRFPEQEQDRIDFVFHRGRGWRATASEVVRTHPEGFPSDHAAVVARLSGGEVDEPELRIATYNIKHGAGMDGRVDLERTARAIEALNADVVALQEVDLGVGRSGGVNQVNELARVLGMHPAFGAFMPYGGGHYGMALLSRHPIVDARSLRLPGGNEPRVALSARLRHTCGQDVRVVCVHFDWVRDDGYRFAQARAVAQHLESLSEPHVLLGDFNDVRGSRTLELFESVADHVAREGAPTFPSDGPDREIDFLFHSRPAPGRPGWTVRSVKVMPEAVASDHRPVRAVLRLAPGPEGR